MARKRIIVGIGEALLAEYPDREEPAGLAATVAVQTGLLGHQGVPISRLGQDDVAARLMEFLSKSEIDITHLQSDPDLQTGRLRVRSIVGVEQRHLDERAAFDNLQWDFDLSDVAQQADAVVFGVLARRTGQARSVIDRFLGECSSAYRVLDLMNRDNDEFRSIAVTAMRYADMVIVDAIALRIIAPTMEASSLEEALRHVVHHDNPGLVLFIDREASRVVLCSSDALLRAEHAVGDGAAHALTIALAIGLLRGLDLAAALQSATEVSSYCAQHPGQQVPQALVNGD